MIYQGERIGKFSALLFASAFFIFGCAKEYSEMPQVREFVKKDPDAAGAVHGVREYNRALILSYQQNDLSPLKDYADERELNKVSHLISGFIAQSLRMEAELKQLSIEKVERWGENNVVVSSREVWEYRRVDIRTGTEAKPLTKIEYRMRYNMIRPEGKWKVFDLAPV